MQKYLPHTTKEIEEMLQVIGIDNLNDLFHNIPKNLVYNNDFNIPSSLSDLELTKHLNNLSNKNKELIVFRGYGAYDTYTPSLVKALTSRQEFLTSYTPYQPEVSQGTLQYIFEYQSMITEITKMDVSNASMYDGATATAEAMFMALAITKRNKVLYSKTLLPRTIEVIKTYGKYRNVEFIEINELDGVTNLDDIYNNLDDAACVILQNPNLYGIIEDLTNLSEKLNENKTLFILNTDITSLALLKTPKELGVDIVTGDLQTLGIPLSFGGPYIGFLATNKKYVRLMPGRICGVTNDVDGKRAFVLTLQAREQHIRRKDANSNICSNQSLMALHVAIYLSLLGKKGFTDLASLSMDGSYYLEEKLIETNLFKPYFNKPHYREFVLKAKIDSEKFLSYLSENGFLGPKYLGNDLYLFAVTEKRTKDEIDKFVEVVRNFK